MQAQQAIDAAAQPLREFMLKQTGSSELELFVNLSREEAPQTADDVPLTTLIPAFMISEIKTAFMIGFLIYVPFLIIDMVVASTLMSMGMMMLPPQMISLAVQAAPVRARGRLGPVGAEPRRRVPHVVTQDFLQGLLGDMMVVVFKLSIPLLISGLGVGLVISVLQAVTQVQEMTLTFVPKVIVAAIVLAMMGPWMLNTLISFTQEVWAHIPEMTASAQ